MRKSFYKPHDVLWISKDCTGEGSGTPLQYSCLENPMNGEAWWATVHEVAKSWRRLSEFTFTFHFHALEKEMTTHSNVLAWRIPGMGEPGGLPSMGSHRVGHDWSDLAAAAGKTTRPFRYDLNQIPYGYTVEVRNRFKGLDLIDRVPDELWMEVRDIV